MEQAREPREFFNQIAADLATHRSAVRDQIQCPLCMQLFSVADVEAKIVTEEHIIPGALGGDAITLSCKACNNCDGSKIDSHLTNAMRALDGWEGKGPLRGTFKNDVGHVSVNFTNGFWTEDTTEIRVVGGAASNPFAVEATRSMFHDGAELSFTLNYGFVPEKYWRSVLRVGYLAVFQCLGYSYVLSDGAAQVRHILGGASPEQGIVLEAYPSAEMPSPLLVLPMSNERVSFYLVIMRLKSAVKRHCAVFLPHAGGCDWSVLRDIATKPEQMIVQASIEDSCEILLRFGSDPISVLREPMLPAEERRN